MLLAGQWAAILVVSGAVLASSAHLSKGIRLYNDADYSGALDALTHALDSDTKRDQAIAHLYIGLIQVRYGLAKDARVSLGKALEYDEKIKLPKGSPKEAQKIFKQLRPTKEPPPPPPPRKPPKKDPRPGPDPPQSDPVRDVEARPNPEATPAIEPAKNPEAPAVAPLPPISSVPPPPSPPPPALLPEPDRSGNGAGSATVHTQTEPEEGPPVAALVGAGIGVAAVATGIVMLFVAKSTNAKADDRSLPAAEAERIHQTALGQQTIGLVSFGVGGVALIAAGVLLLVE